jgi:AmmeMemoRadiSam system protein B
MYIREPAVSGMFYPGDKKNLSRVIKNFLDKGLIAINCWRIKILIR